MEALTIVLTTLLSLVALFLLTKLMGHKQVYQMTMFDYVVGITIGSIAAEMATELEKPWRPLLAMVLYAVVAVLISVVTNHSRAARKQISGTPVVLLDNGKLYRESFRKAKMDLDDFLCACRTEGYFDLSQIQTALLEHNGRVSILPVVGARPATPADLRIQPPQEFLMTPVIMDGEIQWDALTHLGVDETWLRRALERKRGGRPEEVFLALCDRDRELTVYPMA
ncbi:MAG: DUF421 domain-containing protein [Oscillospiraceae bacterium]